MEEVTGPMNEIKELLMKPENLRAMTTPAFRKAGFVICTIVCISMLYYRFHNEKDPKKKQMASAGMMFMMILSIQMGRRMVWAKDTGDADAKGEGEGEGETKADKGGKKGEKTVRKRTRRAN